MNSSHLTAQYQTSTGTRIYRLPVEAFPNMWANTYLVKTGDDLNLIDTGSGSEKSNADLAAGLAQTGFRFEDLTLHPVDTRPHRPLWWIGLLA